MTEVWTIQRILLATQQFFGEKGIDNARLDAEVLLAAVLDVNRVYLYTHYDRPLSGEERDAYREMVRRRSKREPVAQILGRREFYGREMIVSRDVLAPRPETEHLVDAVLDWLRDKALDAPHIVDIGTGSGNIAVTLACELAGATVVATDVCEDALVVAGKNVAHYELAERVQLLHGDLFEPLTGQTFDVIVSNPPYIDPGVRDSLEPEVREWEPEGALFAGDAGMAMIEKLIHGASEFLRQPGLLVFEMGYDQEQRVLALLEGWSGVQVSKDLQEHPRVVCAQR